MNAPEPAFRCPVCKRYFPTERDYEAHCVSCETEMAQRMESYIGRFLMRHNADWLEFFMPERVVDGDLEGVRLLFDLTQDFKATFEQSVQRIGMDALDDYVHASAKETRERTMDWFEMYKDMAGDEIDAQERRYEE